MPIQTTRTITVYTVSLSQGDTGYWFVNYDPISNRVLDIKYMTGSTECTWNIVYAVTIYNLLSSPTVAGLLRPIEERGTNIYREAKNNNILSQFNLPQQVYLGAATIHDPFQLCTEYGAFPSIKFFYTYGVFTWQQTKDAYKYLISNRKIELDELIDELDVSINSGYVTQNEKDELLAEL